MRLTGTREWIVIGALILYIAFTPGFPAVRQLLSTGGGKAASLALIIAVWKYVSEPVALLLAINHVRCAGMREGVDDTLSTLIPNCPRGFTLNKNTNMCEKAGSSPRAGTVCMPPNSKWNPDADGGKGKCQPTEGFVTGSQQSEITTALSGPTGAPPPPPPSILTPTGPPPPPPSSQAKEPFYGGFQPSEGFAGGDFASV